MFINDLKKRHGIQEKKPCYQSRTETQRKKIWLRVLLNYKTCMKITTYKKQKLKKNRVNINYSKNPLIKSTQDN